jgi:hypothetical protein
LRSILFAAACTAVALPCVSSAAEPLNVKPGLWEFNQTMTMSGAPIYIEGMSAAQRAEYAKSWAKDAGKPIADKDQQCITEQEIKEAKLFENKSQEGKQCTNKVIKETKTAWSGASDCKEGKTRTTMQMEYTAPSPERLTGTLKSSTVSPNGTTVFDFKFNGKWVGASCPDEDEDSSSDAETSGEEAAE